MAYKIVWSPKAEEIFEKVIQYLEENWSEKENIFEAIITKHNLLLYQLNDETKEVELLTVFDTRQHPKKKFL